MMNLDTIKEKYRYLTELHAHTSPVSACSHISPETLVDCYLSVGADAVTVTNHLNPKWMEGDSAARAEEYLSDYYAAKKYAEGKGLTVLLGVEIRFPENSNDYLVYGVSPDEVEKMITLLPHGIVNFYKEMKNDKNVILQAHPFRDGMILAPLDSLDGIEVFNMHPSHNSRIGTAARYAKENRLLISGGSDFHDPGMYALCMARSSAPLRDSFDIAEAIKARDLLFDISGNTVIPF